MTYWHTVCQHSVMSRGCTDTTQSRHFSDADISSVLPRCRKCLPGFITVCMLFTEATVDTRQSTCLSTLGQKSTLQTSYNVHTHETATHTCWLSLAKLFYHNFIWFGLRYERCYSTAHKQFLTERTQSNSQRNKLTSCDINVTCMKQQLVTHKKLVTVNKCDPLSH